uniref:Uncharacterized protein n=1 Tax=Rhizophora mucronata TaxID=61149 RepID=A0A2P2LEH7_RHIMU
MIYRKSYAEGLELIISHAIETMNVCTCMYADERTVVFPHC